MFRRVLFLIFLMFLLGTAAGIVVWDATGTSLAYPQAPENCDDIWTVGIYSMSMNRTHIVAWGTWRDWEDGGNIEYDLFESPWRFGIDMTGMPRSVALVIDQFVAEPGFGPSWREQNRDVLKRVPLRCYFTSPPLDEDPDVRVEFGALKSSEEWKARRQLPRAKVWK